jgi:hypothetical protein
MRVYIAAAGRAMSRWLTDVQAVPDYAPPKMHGINMEGGFSTTPVKVQVDCLAFKAHGSHLDRAGGVLTYASRDAPFG